MSLSYEQALTHFTRQHTCHGHLSLKETLDLIDWLYEQRQEYTQDELKPLFFILVQTLCQRARYGDEPAFQFKNLRQQAEYKEKLVEAWPSYLVASIIQIVVDHPRRSICVHPILAEAVMEVGPKAKAGLREELEAIDQAVSLSDTLWLLLQTPETMMMLVPSGLLSAWLTEIYESLAIRKSRATIFPNEAWLQEFESVFGIASVVFHGLEKVEGRYLSKTDVTALEQHVTQFVFDVHALHPKGNGFFFTEAVYTGMRYYEKTTSKALFPSALQLLTLYAFTDKKIVCEYEYTIPVAFRKFVSRCIVQDKIAASGQQLATLWMFREEFGNPAWLEEAVLQCGMADTKAQVLETKEPLNAKQAALCITCAQEADTAANATRFLRLIVRTFLHSGVVVPSTSKLAQGVVQACIHYRDQLHLGTLILEEFAKKPASYSGNKFYKVSAVLTEAASQLSMEPVGIDRGLQLFKAMIRENESSLMRLFTNTQWFLTQLQDYQAEAVAAWNSQKKGHIFDFMKAMRNIQSALYCVLGARTGHMYPVLITAYARAAWKWSRVMEATYCPTGNNAASFLQSFFDWVNDEELDIEVAIGKAKLNTLREELKTQIKFLAIPVKTYKAKKPQKQAALTSIGVRESQRLKQKRREKRQRTARTNENKRLRTQGFCI